MKTEITDSSFEAELWAKVCIRHSAWFECTPLPDGAYRFTVNADVFPHFLKWIGR